MPGYNAASIANNARSGNTCSILIGQQLLAFGQTIAHSMPMGTEQLYGIGTSKPQEIQQLRMSPQLSLDYFELTKVGLQLLANNQNLSYILAGTQFDIHVLGVDPPDQAQSTLFTYVGCKAQNFSANIPTNGIIRETVTFLALDVLDANGVSIMDTGQNALTVASPLASLGAAQLTNGIIGLPAG